jgi:multiple sugar transport system permease protein
MLTSSKNRLRISCLIPYMYVFPTLAILGLILIYPTLHNIFLTVWDQNLLSPEHKSYIGFDNFTNLLFNDPIFKKALGFTLIFTILTISISLLIGLVSALLINTLSKTVREIVSSLYFMPYMVAPIADGLVWKLIWMREYGLANYFLKLVFGLEPIAWLSSPIAALFAVSISEIWRTTPFVSLFLLARLVSLPNEIFEAATIDGSSSWQSFRYMTLPLLLPAVSIIIIFETIFKLRVFDLIFILTGGGPNNSTLPLGIFIYRSIFSYFEAGYTAAASVVLMILGVVVAIIYIKLLYREL